MCVWLYMNIYNKKIYTLHKWHTWSTHDPFFTRVCMYVDETHTVRRVRRVWFVKFDIKIGVCYRLVSNEVFDRVVCFSHASRQDNKWKNLITHFVRALRHDFFCNLSRTVLCSYNKKIINEIFNNFKISIFWKKIKKIYFLWIWFYFI